MCKCDHRKDSHVELSCENITIPPRGSGDPARIWEKICDDISTLLTKSPVRFRYGGRCFSDLIVNLEEDVRRPRRTPMVINEVLCIGSGDGLADCYIASRIFKAKVIHLTNINPENDLVEKLSCVDAIERYKTADTIMFTYPDSSDEGYDDVISKFNGRNVIFTGSTWITGPNNPCELVEQIEFFFFLESVHVDFRSWETERPNKDSLMLYRKAEPLSDSDDE